MPQYKHTIECREVFPDEAGDMLRQGACPWQRNRRPWYVESLGMLMRKGTFMEGAQVHLVLCDGKYYVVNGQHTLGALEQHSGPYTLSILRTEVPDLAAVRTIYKQHDRGLQRTLSDTFQASAAAETMGITQRQINTASGAIPLIMGGFARDSRAMGPSSGSKNGLRDSQVRWDAIQAWQGPLLSYLTDIHGAIAQVATGLMRSGTMSVALVTYRHAPEKASAFWQAVAHDLHRAPHPAHVLRSFLIGMPARLHVAPLYARYIASAWNAAARGVTTSKLQASGLDIPITLVGTPHTAKRCMVYLTPNWEVLTTPVPLVEARAQMTLTA